MTTEQRNKALFETFKGMPAQRYGTSGVICGYDSGDEGHECLIMANDTNHCGAWHEFEEFRPVIESHKRNKHGYLWVSIEHLITE